MADIKLNDLQPAGSEFFTDNEGYLSDLSEDELTVWGGTGGDNNISILNSDVSDINISIGNASLSNISGQF